MQSYSHLTSLFGSRASLLVAYVGTNAVHFGRYERAEGLSELSFSC